MMKSHDLKHIAFLDVTLVQNVPKRILCRLEIIDRMMASGLQSIISQSLKHTFISLSTRVTFDVINSV